MTIPYCCHIISRIEIEYNSPSKPPKWLIYALKNPRVKLNSFDENLLKLTKNDDFATINDLNYDESDNNSSFTEENYSIITTKQSEIGSISLEDNTLTLLKREEEIKPIVQSLITKSMVYYISMYEDFSKDDMINLSKGSVPISKNSDYEMLSGLRDCLSQLYHCNSSSNEAVIITGDYSGVFSHNEILITRSNLSFLQELKAKEIPYTTIYDEIEPLSNDIPKFKAEGEELSKLINSYLTNTPINYSNSPNSKINRMKFKIDDKRVSKIYLLKSLKLPISDDYDINVVRISGRKNCQKLLKLLENNTLNSFSQFNQPFNGVKPDILCVKLILSNFSVLYSKVSQTHFKLSPDNNTYKMLIRGVIIPSSLMSFLNILKLLEIAEVVNRPVIRIKYNLAFDDKMYEKTLRISDNKIYDHFLSNFVEIKKNYAHSYKALKKLIPFKMFKLQQGNISITDEKTLILALGNEKQLYLEDDKQLYLDGILGVKGTNLAIYETPASPDIILLKDSLYSNLAKIKSYLRLIQSYNSVFTGSTKSFLDEVFNNIFFNYSHQTHFNTKLYLDLYPTNSKTNIMDTSNTDNTINGNRLDTDINILPYNLVNIIWILLYILHCSGKMDFWDENSLENLRNNDIFSLNVKESPLKMRREVEKLVVSKTLNFPLSQQSYYIYLVNHINFNNQFKTTFNKNYLEYLLDSNLEVNLYENEKIENIEQILQISSGWNTYFNMKSSSNDDINHDTNSTVNDVNVDIMGKSLVTNTIVTNNAVDRVKANKIVNNVNSSVEKEYKVEFGTVYSLSRNEGRVYECNFDLKHGKFDNINNYHLLDSFDNSLNYSRYNKEHLDSHTILVLLFSNEPSVLECVNLKIIRNVLNSDLIKFSNKTCNYHALALNELNHSNVIKFMNIFTSNEFPNDFTTGLKILTKNFISYSIISSDFDIQDLHTIILKMNKSEVNIICIPLIEGDFNMFSRSTVKMIRAFNELKNEYSHNFTMDFVDISWIFDSYFQGIMKLDSIPQEYLIQLSQEYYAKYSLDNFSIQDFKEDDSSQYRLTMDDLNDFMSSQVNPTQLNTNSQLCGFTQFNTNSQICGGYMDLDAEMSINSQSDNISCSLKFRENYKNVKYFWGWNVYLLRESNCSQLTNQDCLLYRKYCGISIFTFDTLSEIKLHIEETTAESLLKFNITPEDVEAFLSHEKIFLNSVVISKSGSTPDNINSTDLLIYPSIKNKTISFVSCQGIPILSYSWFTNLLNSFS